MPTNELHEGYRKKLEKELIEAALNLMDFMKTASVKIPIPNTDPVVYVVIGEAEKINSLMNTERKN